MQMTFKSDKQRKAVMAKLNQGSVRSDVRPVLQPTGKNKMAKKRRKIILNPRSKSGVVVFIDENGNKRWKFKSKKGSIYAKKLTEMKI